MHDPPRTCVHTVAPASGRRRRWPGPNGWVVLLMAVMAVLAVGCSRDEFIYEGKRFLLGLLVFVGIGVLIAAWLWNKAAGVAASVVLMAAVVAWWAMTRYSEPSADQPHGKITFLSEAAYGDFTVRIDDDRIGFAGKLDHYHKKQLGAQGDGELTVRVTPGRHEIRVGWNHFMGTYTQQTIKDLRHSVDVDAGEVKYILLRSNASGISIGEMTAAEFNQHRRHLRMSGEQRMARDLDLLRSPTPTAKPPAFDEPALHGERLRILQRRAAEEIGAELAAKMNLTAEQKRRLIDGIEMILQTDLPPEQATMKVAELLDHIMREGRDAP